MTCKHEYFVNEDLRKECKKCGLLKTTVNILNKTGGSIGVEKTQTPPHYDYKIQPVDFIEANGLGFCVGNVIKYVCRYDKKGTPLEDLEKASHYIEILKKRIKA